MKCLKTPATYVSKRLGGCQLVYDVNMPFSSRTFQLCIYHYLNTKISKLKGRQ